jgi:hypothetical protein
MKNASRLFAAGALFDDIPILLRNPEPYSEPLSIQNKMISAKGGVSGNLPTSGPIRSLY